MTSSQDRVAEGERTQAVIDELRGLRAGFLDLAIDMEQEIRWVLAAYFSPDESKRDLFVQLYEKRSTLGPIVDRFGKVLEREREALCNALDFTTDDIDLLLAALRELVQNRNRFAHDPMGQWFQVGEAGSVIASEMRIGQEDGPSFTIESAREAFEHARKCEDLAIRAVRRLWRIVQVEG